MHRDIDRFFSCRNFVARERKVEVVTSIVNANVAYLLRGCFGHLNLMGEAQAAKYGGLTTSTRASYHNVILAFNFRQAKESVRVKRL